MKRELKRNESRLATDNKLYLLLKGHPLKGGKIPDPGEDGFICITCKIFSSQFHLFLLHPRIKVYSELVIFGCVSNCNSIMLMRDLKIGIELLLNFSQQCIDLNLFKISWTYFISYIIKLLERSKQNFGIKTLAMKI